MKKKKLILTIIAVMVILPFLFQMILRLVTEGDEAFISSRLSYPEGTEEVSMIFVGRMFNFYPFYTEYRVEKLVGSSWEEVSNNSRSIMGTFGAGWPDDDYFYTGVGCKFIVSENGGLSPGKYRIAAEIILLDDIDVRPTAYGYFTVK